MLVTPTKIMVFQSPISQKLAKVVKQMGSANVDLNNLLANFQKRKPKIELKTKEIKISG